MTEQGYRCGLYLRVSTDLQAQSREGSLKEQEQRLRAYAMSKPKDEGWQVIDVYSEEGRSGKDMERPQLQRLLDDVQSGRINTVVVTKLDRLTRSLLDFYHLHRTFEKYDINFVSIDESFDTTSATGRAMLKITLVFAELERERTSERTKSTMRSRATRGLWNGGQLLGYDIDEAEPGVLKTNEAEADLVREIFETYLECGSVKATARAINERGYRTKAFLSRRGKQQGGKQFNDSHIRKLITNVALIGKTSHSGDVFEGRHEAIIDVRTFRRVQDLIAANTKVRGNVTARTKHTYLLAGLLRCTRCGSSMSPHHAMSKGREYHYYSCTAPIHRGVTACPVRRISAALVEPVVVEAIRGFARKPELIDEVIKEANAAVREGVPRLQRKRRDLLRKKTAIETEARQVLASLKEGAKINRVVQARLDDLDEQLEAVEIGVKEVDDRIRQEEERVVNAEVVKESLIQFDAMWEAARPGEKKEVIRLLVERVTFDGEVLRVELLLGRAIEKVIKPRKRGKKDDEPSGGSGTPRTRRKAPRKRTRTCQSSRQFPITIGKSASRLTSMGKNLGLTTTVVVLPRELTGSAGGTRTPDLVVNSHPLYRLSYCGAEF